MNTNENDQSPQNFSGETAPTPDQREVNKGAAPVSSSPLSSTHTPASSPPRSRSRLRIAYNIGIWLVLLLVIVGIFSPARNIILDRFLAATPTPVPTLIPGDDLFYISATPTGKIFIDGQLLARLPAIGQQPLQLSRGQHLITWQADPFKPLSCVVDIPSQPANEKCPYEANSGANARVITFTASLNDLPATQQTTLKQKIQAALDSLQSSDTVQPGEQYLDGPLIGTASIATATQPLTATLSFHLDTNPTSDKPCVNGFSDNCTVNGENCLQLCTFPIATSPPGSQPSQPPGQESWDVVALFYPTWAYATESGQVVASDQPDGTGQFVGTDHSVLLHVIWDSKGWHVSISSQHGTFFAAAGFVDPACASINDAISETPYYSASQGTQKLDITWNLYTGTNHAAGCLGIVFPSSASTPTPTASRLQPAYFLYRFGVLIAANNLAHSYFPGLPMADAYEQAIASNIAAKYPS